MTNANGDSKTGGSKTYTTTYVTKLLSLTAKKYVKLVSAIIAGKRSYAADTSKETRNETCILI
uniref:Pco067871 n=1 Tax=Arundo donax TaxID=35708 RepID=A0A0A9K950_ARUDO